MLLGTRSDWQSHLRLANSELGFTGVRGHGLLDDDMSVMPNQVRLRTPPHDPLQFNTRAGCQTSDQPAGVLRAQWGSQAGTDWGGDPNAGKYEFFNVDQVLAAGGAILSPPHSAVQANARGPAEVDSAPAVPVHDARSTISWSRSGSSRWLS